MSDPKVTAEFNLERLWKLDHIGINRTDYDSEIAIRKFEDSVSYCPAEKQYEVSLPWRSEEISLPTNYGLALGRLHALQRKLASEPSICKAYDDVFRSYLDRGFIELVDVRESVRRGESPLFGSSWGTKGQRHHANKGGVRLLGPSR